MARAKKRKGKSREGTAKARQIDIHLAPTVELIHKHLTEALCKEVFEEVRTGERERKWTLFCLARFWLSGVFPARLHETASLGSYRGLAS